MIAPRQIFCGKVFFSFSMPGRALPPTSFEEWLPLVANALCLFLAGGLLLPTANRQRGQFPREKLSFSACFRFSFQRCSGESAFVQPAQKSGKHRFPLPERDYSKEEVCAKQKKSLECVLASRIECFIEELNKKNAQKNSAFEKMEAKLKIQPTKALACHQSADCWPH